MDEFTAVLAMTVGRPVFDKTGLSGLYRLEIELPPPAFVLVSRISASLGIPPDPTGVSVSGAVERLGVELERKRIPMDSIVVDTIERVPTDN